MTLTFLRVLSVVVGIIGTTFLLPIAVALAYGEKAVVPSFLIPMIASWLLSAILLMVKRRRKATLTTRSAFALVACSWCAASLFGAIPLYFSGAIPNVIDAIFESISGFTTTGATIVASVEDLPRSINLWRCQTHWLGGMGIVALTVALLPMLGIGGFRLIKAETTGPEKGKLTPKITNTAKALWFIYFGMTLLQVILLKVAGMDIVDAISHAFSTLGTGGFSSRNASIAAFHSPAIDWICTIFMFLASINFSLYFFLIFRQFKALRENSELKGFLLIVLVAVGLTTVANITQYDGFLESLRYGAFQVMSILSTTGFATADYTTAIAQGTGLNRVVWAPLAQLVIFAVFFIGGCAGSTGGGFKVIRWVVLGKAFHNEVLQTLHPHGVFTIRINGKPARIEIVHTVAAFLFIYAILVGITSIAGALAGLDVFTAFTGSLSMMGNVGPAFGTLGPSNTCAPLPHGLKALYSFIMLAGRLEIYTMILYFSPAFWKK